MSKLKQKTKINNITGFYKKDLPAAKESKNVPAIK